MLKRFLNDILLLELDVDEMEVKLLNTELPLENIYEYRKRIDIFVKINNRIYIDIEINRSNFNRVKMRNYLYCSKIYSMSLESGNNVNELEDKYFVQLNLNTKEKGKKIGREEIVLYNITKNEIYMEQEKIILEFIEYYKNLYYTDKKKLDESGFWLAGLGSTTFTEIFDIYSNILKKQELSRFIKGVVSMSLENFNIHEWEKEKMDALVNYNHYKDGINDGIEQNIINTIKEMYKNNIEIELISKITNKSIKEIKNILE